MAFVTETVVQEKALKVGDDGVLKGAKLLGNTSLNGRFYSDEVIASGIRGYEGVKVYLNHPKGRDGASERDFNDWIGIVESAEARKGGAWGDIRFRTEHPRYREICEAVDKFANKCGFSHVADIDSDLQGGTEYVSRIGEVFSVDLVTDPATTKGISESRVRTMKKTLKQIVESTKGLKGKKTLGANIRLALEEAMATGEMPATTEVETPEAATDEQAVKAGLMATISQKLETADAASLKKVLNALGVGDSIAELLSPTPETNTSAPNADAGNPPSPPAEEKKMESRMARLEAENMLHKAGREATEAQIIAVASVPESSKKGVVESFPPKGGAVRESRGGRPDESPPAYSAESTPEADKAYEERVARRVKAAQESLASRKR